MKDLRQFENWKAEVLRIGELMGWKAKALDSFDWEAWKEYFDNSHTPAQAWRQEYEASECGGIKWSTP